MFVRFIISLFRRIYSDSDTLCSYVITHLLESPSILYEQEQSETAYLRQEESGPDPESGLRSRTSGPDDFQNVTGLPCSKLHLWQNFHEDPIISSRDLSLNV